MTARYSACGWIRFRFYSSSCGLALQEERMEWKGEVGRQDCYGSLVYGCAKEGVIASRGNILVMGHIVRIPKKQIGNGALWRYQGDSQRALHY